MASEISNSGTFYKFSTIYPKQWATSKFWQIIVDQETLFYVYGNFYGGKFIFTYDTMRFLSQLGIFRKQYFPLQAIISVAIIIFRLSSALKTCVYIWLNWCGHRKQHKATVWAWDQNKALVDATPNLGVWDCYEQRSTHLGTTNPDPSYNDPGTSGWKFCSLWVLGIFKVQLSFSLRDSKENSPRQIPYPIKKLFVR